MWNAKLAPESSVLWTVKVYNVHQPLTCNVQMLQIGAFGDQIEQRLVRDADTVLNLQMRYFRTPPRQQL